MTFEWYASVASLSLTMVLCLAGAFWPMYEETASQRVATLLQRIGMALLFIGCWPRLVVIYESREMTAAGGWVAHVGLALFAVGTAWKFYRFTGTESKDDMR